MRILAAAILSVGLFSTAQCQVAHYVATQSGADTALLADAQYTPGAINPAVTQATIRQTICVSGWTKTIRPPASYTDALKREQMIAYGDTVPQVPKLAKKNPDLSKCVSHSNDPRCYEEDHKISLEIGGHPRDPKNLYPQPYFPKPGAHEKDAVETLFKNQICSNRTLLVDAQSQINVDWLPVYEQIKGARK